jgi:hypothetical protein
MNNDIGIAILDIYGQDDLNACWDSIPEGTENVIVVSDTNNRLPDCTRKVYGNGVPMATMRNWAINHFRKQGLKHYFLINSNQIIKNANVFDEIIKTAKTFGTWFILGPSSEKVMTIEDDEKSISLNLAPNITKDFIYIFDGVVTNLGFFDERYFNTVHMDILDYVLRLREKKIYPPTGFNVVYQTDIDMTNGLVQKAKHRDMDNPDQSVNMTYAFFLSRHNYMPGHNDPKPATNDELLASLEDIQKNYAK